MGYFTGIYHMDLPHRAKTVYMYLADRADRDGKCYPSIGTMARELNLSRRTIERAVADLVQAGLLTKEQRWRDNGGRSSLLFTIQCRPPPDKDVLPDCMLGRAHPDSREGNTVQNFEEKQRGGDLPFWWHKAYGRMAYAGKGSP